MITHEEARKDLYYAIPCGYPEEMIGKTIQTKRLLDYISQQEKKDELLGLYQILYENNNEHDYDLAPVLVEETENRIKQLEKELGETK